MKTPHIQSIAYFTASSLLLKFALDLCYTYLVSVIFASSGFELHVSGAKLALSYAITTTLSTFVASSFHKRHYPSRMIICLYYAMVILPLLTLYGLANAPLEYLLMVLAGILVLVSTVRLTPIWPIRLPSSRGVAHLSVLLLIALSMYVYGSLFITGGLQRINFNLEDVYEIRSQLQANTFPMMGYLLSWQANVINITLLVAGLHRRSRTLIILAATLQILLFGMTNFKSFLLAPFLVLSIYIFANRRHFDSLILLLFATTALASFLFFLAFDNIFIPSILSRRLFFVPAKNHLLYFDFFAQNPHVFLSNSLLSQFIDYPYDSPVTNLISWHYRGREGAPNVGFIGDAFAHFGFFGIIIFSFLLGLALRIADALSLAVSTKFVAATLAIPAASLVNSAMFTVMLTHGFVVALVLLTVFGRWLTTQDSKEQNASPSIRDSGPPTDNTT